MTEATDLELVLTVGGSLSASVVNQRYADGTTVRWVQIEVNNDDGGGETISLDPVLTAKFREWLNAVPNEPQA